MNLTDEIDRYLPESGIQLAHCFGSIGGLPQNKYAVVSKPHIAPKYEAWAEVKTDQPWAYVSILRKITTR